MNISKGRFFITIAAAFAAGIVLSLAAMIGISHVGLSGNSGNSEISDSKLREIDTYINQYYLRDADHQEMVDNAYRGYVAGLEDPYSSYMTKEEYDNYMTSTSGNYSGIGVTFQMEDNGGFKIVSITPDSPAEAAGIEAGDYILEVDGKTYTDSDVMATNIRGKKGTEVELKILHGEDTKTVKLVRDEIIQHSVESKMLDDSTGYIKISSFISSTGDDFSEALDKIEKSGAGKLVLDLRDNGGGLVDDSISVADEFLDKGVACYVKDKKGNTQDYTVKDGKTDLKTVILVNGNSASASEILAAALQDNGYTIVGQKTFGKGVIQSSFTLSDGDALKLTILEYLSPDKHKVHEKGVKPDVKVKDNADTKADEQLEKAQDLLK